MQSCDGDVPNGATIAAGAAGVHIFSVTATDVLGNHATKTIKYLVLGSDEGRIVRAAPNGALVLSDPDGANAVTYDAEPASIRTIAQQFSPQLSRDGSLLL